MKVESSIEQPLILRILSYLKIDDTSINPYIPMSVIRLLPTYISLNLSCHYSPVSMSIKPLSVIWLAPI